MASPLAVRVYRRSLGRSQIQVPVSVLTQSVSETVRVGETVAAGVGSQFFVATGGSNAAAGSEAAPWQTIKYALTQAVAGDTVWLRGGTHTANLHQSGSTAWHSGASFDNAITIRPYPTETVSITAQLGYQWSADPARYHIWQDLVFDGGGWYSADASHHIRLLRCEIKNVPTQSFHQSQDVGHHIEAIDCSVHHNGTDTFLEHGFYLKGDNNLIQGCDIYSNAASGIQFYPNGSNSVITGNRIHGHGTAGIQIQGGSGNVISNNLIWGNGVEGVLIITQTGTVVYHNTIYNNATGVAQNTGGSGNVVRNNILYANSVAGTTLNAGSWTVDHNSSNATNPVFVSTSSGSEDFHLTAGTPGSFLGAGDTGTGVTTDFEGDARNSPPDLGAFEYP